MHDNLRVLLDCTRTVGYGGWFMDMADGLWI